MNTQSPVYPGSMRHWLFEPPSEVLRRINLTKTMPFTDLELRVVIVRPGTRNQVLLLNRNGPEVPSIRPGMSISESTTQVVLEELRLPLEHRCFFGMQFVDLAYAPFFQDFDAQDIHRAIVCITVAVDNSALRSGHVLAWYPDLAGRHPTHIWADVTSSQASQAFGNAPFSTIRQIDIDGRVSCFTRAAQELPLAERQTLCKDIFGSMMSIKAFIEGIMVDDVLFVTSIKASRTRISLLPVPIGMHFAACRRAQGFWCDDPTNIFAVVGSVKGSLGDWDVQRLPMHDMFNVPERGHANVGWLNWHTLQPQLLWLQE